MNEIPIDTAIIKKYEKRALWLLISAGLCFILAICSFLYAEFMDYTVVKGLDQELAKKTKNCKLGPSAKLNTNQKTQECIMNQKLHYIKLKKNFYRAIKPFFWTWPLMLISLSTILGYLGLIWWAVYQPASKRPFIAISAMGILIQTILMIWIIVMRFVGLPV